MVWGGGASAITHAGPPVTADGSYSAGNLVYDSADSLWLCTVTGTPGTWVQVGVVGGFANPMTTAGDLIDGGAAGVPQRLAVGAVNTHLVSDGTNPGWQIGLVRQATTGLAGTALINGTPTILTWTSPNDGLMHRVIIMGEVTTSSTETGGQIQAQYTPPTGGAQTATLDAGAHGISVNGLSYFARTVGPNTAVNLVQSSALTGGAAIIYAELWAS